MLEIKTSVSLGVHRGPSQQENAVSPLLQPQIPSSPRKHSCNSPPIHWILLPW